MPSISVRPVTLRGVAVPTLVLSGLAAAQAPTRMQLARGGTVYHDQTGLMVPHTVGRRVRPPGNGGFFAFRPVQGPEQNAPQMGNLMTQVLNNLR